ncbi:hypothetical protein [Herbaspirillum sp. RV1423]|uniref:hypothetical protein n=1 Tax=Herbaspirillum sp. RV1423 TaxID=1443993 RepID=UPI0004B5CA35|nr:hypothetical protein [Herbaspirillum sp. RV1423]
MTDLPVLDSDGLRALAQRSAAVTAACACAEADLSCWTSTPLSFPESQLKDVGTLLADPYDEPGFAEYHPHGTRYESGDAPIAPRYFPYNRCNVSACAICGRCYLRYTEAGGYFVDRRIRALNRPGLVVDAD